VADLPADHPVAVQVRTEVMLQLFGDFQEAADAALQATYRSDPIARFLRGRISARQLRVLVEGLPPDSAFHRAARENDWADGDWINRDTNSVLRVLLYTVESALSERRPPKPEFLPSPIDGRTVQDDVEAEYLAQQRAEMDDVAAGWFANN